MVCGYTFIPNFRFSGRPLLGKRVCSLTWELGLVGRGLSYQCVVRNIYIYNIYIWRWLKSPVPCRSHQNSWDSWMFIPISQKDPNCGWHIPMFWLRLMPMARWHTRLFRHRSRQSKLSSCVVAGVAEAPGNGNGSPRKMGHFSLRKRLDLVICRGTQLGMKKR